ncbi:TPA: hypothetical protein ACGO9Y_000565 [Streptococcus suis]
MEKLTWDSFFYGLNSQTALLFKNHMLMKAGATTVSGEVEAARKVSENCQKIFKDNSIPDVVNALQKDLTNEEILAFSYRVADIDFEYSLGLYHFLRPPKKQKLSERGRKLKEEFLQKIK